MTALIRKNVGVGDSDLKRITAEFGYILPLFMFRRSEYSQWLGYPLIVLPKLRYTIYQIPFPTLVLLQFTCLSLTLRLGNR